MQVRVGRPSRRLSARRRPLHSGAAADQSDPFLAQYVDRVPPGRGVAVFGWTYVTPTNNTHCITMEVETLAAMARLQRLQSFASANTLNFLGVALSVAPKESSVKAQNYVFANVCLCSVILHKEKCVSSLDPSLV